MEIINCTLTDVDFMLELYRKAAEYQKANGYNQWKEFDRDLIVREIHEKRQWKIMIDGQIACIFMVAYDDLVIWGPAPPQPSPSGREQGSIQNSTSLNLPLTGGPRGADNMAIYLHRITTNQLFKGRNMMQVIIDWSKNHCKETGRKYIRMDTWADNKNLTDYYTKCGFTIKDFVQLDKDTKGLPKHYSTLSLVLFEMVGSFYSLHN